jgi:hypothetical protein
MSSFCASWQKTSARNRLLPFSGRPPYVGEMVRLLGLKIDNPPKGWLTCLIDALKSGGEQSHFLLDECMNSGPNELDERLISIKSNIRGTNITAIVLTQNVEAVDSMLGLNGLRGIQPLQSAAATEALRLSARDTVKMERDTGPEM